MSYLGGMNPVILALLRQGLICHLPQKILNLCSVIGHKKGDIHMATKPLGTKLYKMLQILFLYHFCIIHSFQSSILQYVSSVRIFWYREIYIYYTFVPDVFLF